MVIIKKDKLRGITMKNKISIVIFILVSFLNIGAISSEVSNTKNSFGNLETNISNISEFKENGLKLQYMTKDNIEKEGIRIKDYLTNHTNGKYEKINENEFEIVNGDFDIKTKIWCEDKYTYVEITLINTNVQYTSIDLKNILKNVENTKVENTQYFSYYEGKEKGIDTNYFADKLVNENYIRKINILKINNGYTGTGYLSNGEKINFALVKYNTGSYIIIGTPIIFTTY
jgi:hypothetical protein